MKKVYYILVAAVVLVFASCKKYDDDIKRINDRLNRIEGTYISNIDKQIVGINSSLTDLSAVDVAMQKSIDALTSKSNELSDELKNNATADVATKSALEKEIADLNALIAALQASDASLDGKITALQTYVGSELSATEDWATATFATLEQYSSLQTELAAIKALVDNGNTTIDELTQSINDAVAASEQSMKAWVNEQLAAGYYDIATIDAKLSALKGDLADADSELAKNIEAQRAALEQAKSYLTAAYKEAIADAIETNNGLFNSTIAESVQAVKDKVDVRLALIDNTIASIQNEINTINSRIATIEQQIVGIVSSLYDLSAVDSALQKTVADLTAKSNELSEELKNNATADAATKSALEKEISDLNALISALQASNDLLDGKITALQTYVGSGLSATEDWATATFATLEQYASLQTELAAIKLLVGNGSGNTSVDELTQAINGAIVASEQSMKAWVNEQLAVGYYDIATIDVKLSALKGELTSSDSELAKDIEAQSAALDQAKSELTAAYKEAINVAIETNNGLLNSTIANAVQTAIDKVETKLAVIDNALVAIQQEIENIKNSIAGIQDQITAINGSLADLESVDAVLQKTVADLTAKSNELSEELKNNATADSATKTALEKEISDLNALIATLQASNASLDGKITALQTYVGSELSSTEDWAIATFATLEQYASLQTELAAIKVLVGNGSGNTNIEELTQAINGAIAASEQSMKAWVNEQLAAGYYDIATIDAKLSALKGELTSSDSELSKDIEAQRAALEQAKSELTAAYKSAISDAIETNNGVINSAIASAVQTAIDKVETKLAVIDNALAAIQQEIENIKSSIAGIQDQITGINASLYELKAADNAMLTIVAGLIDKRNEFDEELKNNAAADAATKTALEKEIADLNALIVALQASDASLDRKIMALQTYVSNELPAIEDWATATFATLEQYASLQTELAAIKALVGNSSGNVTVDELTQEINGAIAASEESMKAWVNEQLAAGYYDIATIDAKLSALAGELTSSDSELSKDIEAQRAALEQAKSELTAAYKSAISEAIETNNGKINTAISSAVQTALGNVDTKLTGINSALADIQLQINKIANRIQSVTYIPQYADGKIKIDYTSKTTELYLRISPAALATSIEKSMVKAFARYTDDPRTRALNEEFNVSVTQISGNASSGILHICLAEDASNKFSKSFWDGYVEAIIYIQISDGNNDIVSQAVPVVGYSIEPEPIDYSTQPFTITNTGTGVLTIKHNDNTYNINPNESVQIKQVADEAGSIKQVTDVPFTVSGNIMSLIYGDDFVGKTDLSGKISVFLNLFFECTKLTDASNLVLPATTLASACYAGMFNGCSSLTEAPALPATTLAGECYNSMFSGCRSLTEAPALPATTLAINCYAGMFNGCSSLTEAPALPATTLAEYCYSYMFADCSSLTEAPALPATTLASFCYSFMFSGCSSLVEAPALSATTLAAYCCTCMFSSCSSLVEAPALPATTLADKCYYNMFYGCSSLTEAPALPATKLANGCYEAMFDDCSSLVEAPALPATTLAGDCYKAMFDGCEKLNYIKMLATNISAEDCLLNWTYGVSKTGTFVKASGAVIPSGTSGIPEGWTVLEPTPDIIDYSTQPFTITNTGTGVLTIKHNDNTYNINPNESVQIKQVADKAGAIKQVTNVPFTVSGNIMSLIYGENFVGKTDLSGKTEAFISLFENCTKLTDASNLVLPANTLAYDCYTYMFSDCSSLTEAPALPATTLAGSCYNGMFWGCSSLTEAPALPATTLAECCYEAMFYGCSSLTQAPALPATTLASSCYKSMFSGCSSLTEAPALPATTLAKYCYSAMFEGCSSLTEAPTLPATTLAEYCYSSMFEGCSLLTQAPALPAPKLESRCYSAMFSGCSSLTEAPTLPATMLDQGCYSAMFSGCSSLTEAPALPATKSASSCYSAMFYGCSSLTEAPALPATMLAPECYSGMFSGCRSLTEAPELPAYPLAERCYSSMFSGCRSLVEAPALPATKLAEGCYLYMFYGCEKLNYIKMLATNISATVCLSSWTEGVSKTGTFVKASGAVIPSGTSGIPSGWTVSEPTPEPVEKVVTVNGVSFKMVPVKGGTFNMGSTSGESNEKPVHSVTLSDYAIGETEVTQELWKAVMGTNPSRFEGNKKPVECVSWDDCQTFITKLNGLTGGKFRLPTEAEWEFAARGGVKSKGYTYSGSNTIDDVAWYTSNSNITTHDVATKVANELGIYDMSGNVYEWCQDWYGADYYSSSPVNNPTGPSSGTSRVYRGGEWKGTAGTCRFYSRHSNHPSNSFSGLGLRLAL